MKRAFVLTVLVFLLISGTSWGKVYSLDECIKKAHETDVGLTRFRNSVKTAKSSLWLQAGKFLPTLSVSGSYNKTNLGRTSEKVDNLGAGIIDTVPALPSVSYKRYSAGIRADYSVFNGLKDIWGFLGSKATKRVIEYDYVTAASDLAYIVKGQYYLVLKSKRDIDVAREAIKRSKELLKLFQGKYDLGSASLSEVLKQKVQFGNDKLTLVRTEKTHKVALDALAVTIGINPNEEFAISGLELKKEVIKDLPELVRQAKTFHPWLWSSKEEINASQYDVRSAYGQYLPRVVLSYSFGWSKNTFKDISKFDRFDHTEQIYVGVSYDIFNGFSRHANMSRAKATLSNAKATSFFRENEVIKRIRDVYLGIKLAEETLAVTEETELAASQDMDLVQAKYNLGAAALWELLDAQVSVKRAQFNKVAAEFDYNLAVAKLYNALGE